MINIDWETRAKDRRFDNKRLKKKIKELTISRDGWKKKAMERQAIIDEQNKKLLTVKKNLKKIMVL